jgi:hypothetical protein
MENKYGEMREQDKGTKAIKERKEDGEALRQKEIISRRILTVEEIRVIWNTILFFLNFFKSNKSKLKI